MTQKQCRIKLQKRFWMDFRDSDKDYPEAKTMFNVTPKTPFEIRQTEKFREATASAEYMQGTPDGKRPGIFIFLFPTLRSLM